MERALDVLLTAGSEALDRLVIRDEGENGVRLIAAIKFQDSQLDVRMLIRVSDERPLIEEYSFHYMTDNNATIFRYDNSRHHLDFHTAPHHKHTGADEQVIAHPQPSVSAIRAEIAAYLGTA